MLAKTLRLMIAAACIDNAEGQLAKRWKEKFKCFESKTAGSIKFEGLQLAGWEFRAGTGQLENPKLEEIHSFLSPLQNTLCKTNDMPDILTATSHFMFVVSQKLFNIQGFGQEYFLGVTSFCAPLFSARRRFICFTRHG